MSAPYAVIERTRYGSPMALLGREFIAVPDDRKGQIVFKWPDITIRRFTRAIVNADEMALFVNTGQVVQTMGPGRHQIDANELPGSRCGHRLHHRRERVPRRAVLRRHPRVHRLQVRRPGRRRAGPADRAGRDATGVRRLRDAGGRSGAAGDQHDRHGRRHRQRADRRLGERPAAQGAADPRHHPDHPQRLADPGPDGVLGGDRAGHHRRRQRPARRLRRAADPDGQLRRQPLPRGRAAAQAAGQGHELLPAGRRLPELRGRRDGARRGPGHGQGRRRGRRGIPRCRIRAGQRVRRAAGPGPAGRPGPGRPAGRGPVRCPLRSGRSRRPTQPAAPSPVGSSLADSRRAARRPSRPRPARCARPARRRTRRGRSSAWAAVRRSRRPSSTARNAAPNSRPARSSAPVAAPASAPDAAAELPPPPLLLGLPARASASAPARISPRRVRWPRGRCRPG